ncbi:MAG TPA: MazG nucleotide pyrophosphohydrolase domain-containing protein [Planctomycetota bacterium]
MSGLPDAAEPLGPSDADKPLGLSDVDKPLGLSDFQHWIERIYFEKDRARGTAATYMWFAEEVGELTRALRRGEAENLAEEFADVLAWLATLASIHGVDLQAAARAKYGQGCPYCRAVPCACVEKA